MLPHYTGGLRACQGPASGGPAPPHPQRPAAGAALAAQELRALAGVTHDDLVGAVAIQVHELEVVAGAAGRRGHQVRTGLAAERALAVAQEHPRRAGAVDGHEIEGPVAIEVPGVDRPDVGIALERPRGAPLPPAAVPGVEDVDAGAQHPQLAVAEAHREVQTPVA